MNLSLTAESEAVGTELYKETAGQGRGVYRIRYKIVKFDFPPPPSRGGGRRRSHARGVYLRRLDGNAKSEPEGTVVFKSKAEVTAMIEDKGFGVLSPRQEGNT